METFCYNYFYKIFIKYLLKIVNLSTYNREGIYLPMVVPIKPKLSFILIGQIEKKGNIKMVCIIGNIYYII